MPSVSKEEKAKSEEFMKVIHQLLNFIEELARNDNEYLDLMISKIDIILCLIVWL